MEEVDGINFTGTYYIIGDFYVQTDKMAEKKKNLIKYMLIHCLIYSIVIGICFYILVEKLWGH